MRATPRGRLLTGLALALGCAGAAAAGEVTATGVAGAEAAGPVRARELAPGTGVTLVTRAPSALDPAIAARLLALDPERIGADDVREVLARVPAPRIVALHGSVPIVDMTPFAEFLIAMGYPEAQLRNPADGRLTYSSFGDSRRLAGVLAWHFEREGVMPMLIGHSQGGMLTMKVLQDLAGASGAEIAVWDPRRDAPEPRAAIVDPLSGAERPVVGLRVPYAAVLATGSLMRIVLGQWGMISRLRSVPDTVDEFTGFLVPWDPIAGTGADPAAANPYRPTGAARVRNVNLPAEYGHINLPLARHLASQPATRAWIERYDPRAQGTAPPAIDGADLANIVHAADIWFSVKKHWCLEAQRWARARGHTLQARR